MEKQFHFLVGSACADIVGQGRKRSFESRVNARQPADLLQADVVPRLVSEGGGETSRGYRGLRALNHLAIGVGRLVPGGILHMHLQRAAADVHVANDQIDALGVGQFPQVLFHGVFGKTVADGQNPDGFRGGRFDRHDTLRTQGIVLFAGDLDDRRAESECLDLGALVGQRGDGGYRRVGGGPHERRLRDILIAEFGNDRAAVALLHAVQGLVQFYPAAFRDLKQLARAIFGIVGVARRSCAQHGQQQHRPQEGAAYLF